MNSGWGLRIATDHAEAAPRHHFVRRLDLTIGHQRGVAYRCEPNRPALATGAESGNQPEVVHKGRLSGCSGGFAEFVCCQSWRICTYLPQVSSKTAWVPGPSVVGSPVDLAPAAP
jgi:hypothetical protein